MRHRRRRSHLALPPTAASPRLPACPALQLGGPAAYLLPPASTALPSHCHFLPRRPAQASPSGGRPVRVNVGGTVFWTTSTTLASTTGHYLASLFKDGEEGSMQGTRLLDDDGIPFIDRWAAGDLRGRQQGRGGGAL